MKEFTIKMPIHVELGKTKKKKYYLNLNIMRNQVGHVINNTKKEYKRIAYGTLPTNVYYENYSLIYELFLPNRLKRDVSNVCSVIDKFFNDALVELGIVPEDNYHYLRQITYKLGGYDEDRKGYVLITVKEEDYEEM